MKTNLKDFVTEFIDTHELVPVDGEYYDLPGKTVYSTATRKLPEKGRLEVNVVGADAAEVFAWESEITLKDKVNGEFIHAIITTEGELEETYGKTVIPIDDDREQEIVAAIALATASD